MSPTTNPHKNRRPGILAVAAALLLAPLGAAAQMPEAAFEDGIAYDEFLIAGPLNDSEQAQIRAILNETYRDDPAKAAQNSQAVHQALARIQADRDALDQELLRERIWDQINHLLTSGKATADMKAEVAVLRASPALYGADAAGQVTRTDIAGQFASDDAIARLAGLPAFTNAQIEAYAQNLRIGFPGLAPEARDAIMHAGRRWAALDHMLADPQMRQAVLRDIHAHVHSQNDIAPVARAEETVALRYGAIGQQELAIARQQGQLMIPGNALVDALTGGN